MNFELGHFIQGRGCCKGVFRKIANTRWISNGLTHPRHYELNSKQPTQMTSLGQLASTARVNSEVFSWVCHPCCWCCLCTPCFQDRLVHSACRCHASVSVLGICLEENLGLHQCTPSVAPTNIILHVASSLHVSLHSVEYKQNHIMNRW